MLLLNPRLKNDVAVGLQVTFAWWLALCKRCAGWGQRAFPCTLHYVLLPTSQDAAPALVLREVRVSFANLQLFWAPMCSLLGGAQLGATKPQGHTAQQGAARQQVGGGSGMASNAAVEKAEPQAGQCCHGPKKDS